MEDVKVIKTENGPVRIDASDFKEGEHELHVANETHDENGIRRDALAPQPATSKRKTTAKPAANAPDGANTGNDNNGDGSAIQRNYDAFGVMQKGSKFLIVDGANGGKVVDDVEAIDPKGYASNADAWNVLLTLKAKPATDNA